MYGDSIQTLVRSGSAVTEGEVKCKLQWTVEYLVCISRYRGITRLENLWQGNANVQQQRLSGENLKTDNQFIWKLKTGNQSIRKLRNY